MSSEGAPGGPVAVQAEQGAPESVPLTGLASPKQQAAPVAPPPMPLPSAGPGRRENDSRVLKLKGLPYTTSEQQVLDFFAGYNVQEVAFVYEPDGRPSGLAFAEFATREEALQALSKNGEYLGDRYVRLLHVPKQEMEEQVRLGTLAIPGAQAKMRQKMLRSQGMDGLGPYSDALQMPGGLGQQVGMPDLGGGGYHGGLPLGMPHSMGQPGMPLPGMNLGMGPGSMPHPGMGGEQYASLQGPNAGAGRMPPHMALAYQLGGMSLGGQARGGPGGMAMMGMMGGPGPHAGYGPGAGGPAQPMAVIGTDSKTIKIRGLPFRATPLDIFNFFESYDVIAESLQLGVDALGRPSGEAWLTFTSSEEALRAVRERNRHYLGNRYLELSLT